MKQGRKDGSKRRRSLTVKEQEALAKVETGYVRRNNDGELLIIDDTAYFRQCEEREKEAEAQRQRDREAWGLPGLPE